MIVKDPLLDSIFDDKKPEPKHKNIGSKFEEEMDEKFGVAIKLFDKDLYKAKKSITFEEGEIRCDGVKVASTPVCPTKIELIKGIQRNANFFKK